MESRIVMALYKVRDGKEDDFLELLKNHLPTLQKLELATDRQPIFCKSEGGVILEIFEWRNENSSKLAHSHPEVAMIWEKMAQLAEFSTLSGISEASKSFPHFKPLTM